MPVRMVGQEKRIVGLVMQLPARFADYARLLLSGYYVIPDGVPYQFGAAGWGVSRQNSANPVQRGTFPGLALAVGRGCPENRAVHGSSDGFAHPASDSGIP